MPPCHIPVMLDEVIEWLQPTPGKTIVDGTLGGGGHTAALAAHVEPDGCIVGVDLDPTAVDGCTERLAGLAVQVTTGNYTEIPTILASLKLPAIDGILLDLGLSSDQLADVSRGFSFQSGGELDLRFDTSRGEPAWKMLARIDEQRLADIIYRYGEERYSRRIAKRIVQQRRENPIRNADQLADLVRSCVPRSRGHRIDPATRTFQALRIAANSELESLRQALDHLPDCLLRGGRLAIISFHSLEDRIVKHAFRDDERVGVLTRRPVVPSDEEVARNPRARSAKLRVAERV